MEDSKYVLFGAGQVGRTFVDVIGRENVICFLDNDLQKIGKKNMEFQCFQWIMLKKL